MDARQLNKVYRKLDDSKLFAEWTVAEDAMRSQGVPDDVVCKIKACLIEHRNGVEVMSI